MKREVYTPVLIPVPKDVKEFLETFKENLKDLNPTQRKLVEAAFAAGVVYMWRKREGMDTYGTHPTSNGARGYYAENLNNFMQIQRDVLDGIEPEDVDTNEVDKEETEVDSNVFVQN